MNCTCVLPRAWAQGPPAGRHDLTSASGVKLDLMRALCVRKAGLSFQQTSLSGGQRRQAIRGRPAPKLS